jgi:hypothetical protein
MSFKQYLTEGKPAGEISATLLEKAVPHIWSVYLENDGDIEETLKSIDDEYKPYFNRKKIQMMTKTLSSLVGESPLEFIGSGAADIRESEFWKQLAIDEDAEGKKRGTEPKTDFLTPDEAYRISFKKPGGSVIFFGGEGDAKATLYAAYEEFKDKPQGFDSITKMAKNNLKKVKIKDTLENMDKRFQVLRDILDPEFKNLNLSMDNENDIREFSSDKHEVTAAFEEYMELRTILINVSNARELKDAFLQDLKVFFEENILFKSYFVREALTGLKKFEDTPKGIANYLMSTYPHSGETKVRLIDMSLCESLAKSANIKLRIDFKSSLSKKEGGTAWSAIKLAGPVPSTKVTPGSPEDVEAQTFFGNEQVNETIFDEWVEEYILSEGLFSNATNWLSNLFHWLYKKVAQAAKKGLNVLLDLFGVEMIVNVDQKKFDPKMLG